MFCSIMLFSSYFSSTRTKNLYVLCKPHFKIQFGFMKNICFVLFFSSYFSSTRTKNLFVLNIHHFQDIIWFNEKHLLCATILWIHFSSYYTYCFLQCINIIILFLDYSNGNLFVMCRKHFKLVISFLPWAEC